MLRGWLVNFKWTLLLIASVNSEISKQIPVAQNSFGVIKLLLFSFFCVVRYEKLLLWRNHLPIWSSELLHGCTGRKNLHNIVYTVSLSLIRIFMLLLLSSYHNARKRLFMYSFIYQLILLLIQMKHHPLVLLYWSWIQNKKHVLQCFMAANIITNRCVIWNDGWITHLDWAPCTCSLSPDGINGYYAMYWYVNEFFCILYRDIMEVRYT